LQYEQAQMAPQAAQTQNNQFGPPEDYPIPQRRYSDDDITNAKSIRDEAFQKMSDVAAAANKQANPGVASRIGNSLLPAVAGVLLGHNAGNFVTQGQARRSIEKNVGLTTQYNTYAKQFEEAGKILAGASTEDYHQTLSHAKKWDQQEKQYEYEDTGADAKQSQSLANQELATKRHNENSVFPETHAQDMATKKSTQEFHEQQTKRSQLLTPLDAQAKQVQMRTAQQRADAATVQANAAVGRLQEAKDYHTHLYKDWDNKNLHSQQHDLVAGESNYQKAVANFNTLYKTAAANPADKTLQQTVKIRQQDLQDMRYELDDKIRQLGPLADSNYSIPAPGTPEREALKAAIKRRDPHALAIKAYLMNKGKGKKSPTSVSHIAAPVDETEDENTQEDETENEDKE
jgi:hypothetical protein